MGSNNVFRSGTSVVNYSGLKLYYTVAGTHPAQTNISKLLTVNYYDTYLTGDDNYPAGGTPLPARPSAILTQNTLGDNILQDISTKGLPTASYVNNIEDDQWTKTYLWYDTKGRNIGTSTINHLGGATRTESFLDFSGAVKQSFTYHKRQSTIAEVVVKEDFEYDGQKRLWKHFHEVIGKSPKTLLAQNHYNEIGQITGKTVGADQYGNNPLQDISYDYNIRGWLTGINKGDILQNAAEESFELTNGKLFGYEVHYQDPRNPTLAPPKYNGNIAQVSWIDSYTSMKSYAYKYDGLNRLLSGIFLEPGLTLPQTHSNDEILSYDLNGNISSLLRKTKLATKPFSVIVIDNLTYNILGGSGNSNKILSISDASGNFSGYEGGGNPMSYDDNGNITALPDKGISSIAYNFLNLPKLITQHTNVTRNSYRADGVKIRKEFALTNASGIKTIETEYLDGFQYSTPNVQPLRRALEEQDAITVAAVKAGNEEAFSAPEERLIIPGPEISAIQLSFFPTAEGYYDYINFRYIYQYKDHLGNVRVSYVRNGTGSAQVVDRNDYYPFGMSFLKSQSGVSYYDPMAIPYNYKFGGKELQETGMYDFGARMYMPDVGIFGTHDPLSEKTLQPYAYAYNNPIFYNDPTGMEGEEAASDSGGGGTATGSGGVEGDFNIGFGVKASDLQRSGAAMNVYNYGDGGQSTIVRNGEKKGTYVVTSWIDDGKTDVNLENGIKLGESLTTHSFVNENGYAVIGAVINTNSKEGQNFIDNEIIKNNPGVIKYMLNAYKVGSSLDFKSRGLNDPQNNTRLSIHAARGSMTNDGKMASARDFGNMAAGIVAGRAGFSYSSSQTAFNALQGGPEPAVSQKAQQIGHTIGVSIRNNQSNHSYSAPSGNYRVYP